MVLRPPAVLVVLHWGSGMGDTRVLKHAGAATATMLELATCTMLPTLYAGITCNPPGGILRGSNRVMVVCGVMTRLARFCARDIARMAWAGSARLVQSGVTTTIRALIPSAASFALAPWIAAICWILT